MAVSPFHMQYIQYREYAAATVVPSATRESMLGLPLNKAGYPRM